MGSHSPPIKLFVKIKSIFKVRSWVMSYDMVEVRNYRPSRKILKEREDAT